MQSKCALEVLDCVFNIPFPVLLIFFFLLFGEVRETIIKIFILRGVLRGRLDNCILSSRSVFPLL